MTLPRVGIIESLLVLIMVLVLATIANINLFLTIFTYIAAIFFLAITIREAAHYFLNDHKALKGRNLQKFSNALITAVPIGILYKLIERAPPEASVFGFLFLGLLLGLFIESQYNWQKDRHRPYTLGLILIVVLHLFQTLLYLLYAPLSAL